MIKECISAFLNFQSYTDIFMASPQLSKYYDSIATTYVYFLKHHKEEDFRKLWSFVIRGMSLVGIAYLIGMCANYAEFEILCKSIARSTTNLGKEVFSNLNLSCYSQNLVFSESKAWLEVFLARLEEAESKSADDVQLFINSED